MDRTEPRLLAVLCAAALGLAACEGATGLTAGTARDDGGGTVAGADGGASEDAASPQQVTGNGGAARSYSTWVCGDGDCVLPETAESCPMDCGPNPVDGCGDGTCDPSKETAYNCPKDCKGQTPLCGDGQCWSSHENPFTCQQDCKGLAGSFACLKTKCTALLADCVASEACSDAVGCRWGCKGKENCLAACVKDLAPEAAAKGALLQACGAKANCIGSGGPPWASAVCGDTVCQPQETAASCPQDCGPSSTSTCGDGKCDLHKEDKANCPADCVGPDELPGCGDGVCSPPTENPFSCLVDCKGYGGPYLCLKNNCGPKLSACIYGGNCGKAMGCILGCGGPNATCRQGCKKGLTSEELGNLDTLWKCGFDVGCFKGKPPWK